MIITIAVVRSLYITALLPFLFFIPAVLGLALMLGKGPGLYATVLAAVSAGIALGSPREPAWLTGAQWVSAVLFLLVTALMVLVIAQLRTTYVRAGRLTIENDETSTLLREREAFLSSVLASSTDCIKVLDLDGRLTFMSEGGQRVMEVSDFNQIAQCPWPDFWQGEGNVEAKRALEEARKGKSTNFIGRAATFAGNVKWWDVAVSPILDRNGEPERILSVSRDITVSRENEEKRTQLARLVENSDDFIGMARLDGTSIFLNDAGCRLVGLKREQVWSTNVADFFPLDQALSMQTEVLPAVAKNGAWTGERVFQHFQTGELIPVLCSIFPVNDYDGTMVGFGTVTRDLRERKRAEDQLHLLNQEISHRLKNSLALVQAVANQTLRNVADREAVRAFEQRLLALSSAHDILLRRNWTTANMADVIMASLATIGQDGRVDVSGPDVQLGSRASLSLSLLIHELATNALKYGALSTDRGRVIIHWATKDGTLTFAWTEEGGPEVHAPERRGFGSRLIRLGLVGAGGVEVEYPREGFKAHMTASLDELASA